MVPAIRFKGFNDAWEQNVLGAIGELKNGMNFGKDAMGHGYPFVNLQDVFGKNIVNDTNLGLAVSNENQRKEYSLEKGDILFIRSSVKPEGVGETALVEKKLENTTYSGFIIRFRANIEMNDSFKRIVFSITGIRKQILSNATSSANTNINQDSIKKIQLQLPNIDEQTQIGSYFQRFDKLISLHQAKVNKLVNLKKAMLEKMFPKDGADVPEIRFKGFEEAWEDRAVNTIADRYDNLRIPITASDRVAGDTPYYGANGIQDYVSGYTHDGEFILIAEDGANDLKNYPVQYVYGQIWVNNHAHVLQAKNKITCNIFLKYAFSQVNIEPFLVGGGRAKLNAETMMNIEISVPLNINEQEKIGTYFQNLDKLITLHQSELDKLNNLKKACLEKMFV